MPPLRPRKSVAKLLPLPVVAALLVASLPGPSSAESAVSVLVPHRDYGLFLNILPPGQGTTTTTADAVKYYGSGQRPKHDVDQIGMYEALPVAKNITDKNLTNFFKKETFTTKTVERTETPRPGVTILRDAFGVPHIHGVTRRDAMFGAGYVTAEDRLFMIDVLRHVGDGHVSELLGPTQTNLALDRASYLVSGYSLKERIRQYKRMVRFGHIGRQVLRDGLAFVNGINARIQEDMQNPNEMPAEYPALQIQPKMWAPADVVSIATLIQAVFAAGGGGELQNASFLNKAQARYGQRTGRALWRDLREQEDPAAPVTADGRFPYEGSGKVDPRSVALPDPGTIKAYDPIRTEPPGPQPAGGGTPVGAGPGNPIAMLNPADVLRQGLARIGIAFPGSMSNWLAVTGKRTASGHPIAVMGPQTAYWSPEILMEIDIHAPGLDARGATFPGLSQYVLLGRGKDFAWSATSGESDLVDVRAEKLCRPGGKRPSLSSKHYLFRGRCLPMYQRTDSWIAKPTAGGSGEPKRVVAHVERTRHGPVIARGRVNGAPVAFTSQRTSFKKELDSAQAFAQLNDNRPKNATEWQHVMNGVTGSFNWLYVDNRDVAYFHSGDYPVRAPGVDPNFPSWGTGKWEWRGRVPFSRHPHEINPRKGWISSWNNKPARGWRAADGNWDFGPVHRVQMLSKRLAARIPHGNVHPADMVRIMAKAATVDLRGQEDLPSVLRVMGRAPKVGGALRILRAWVKSGSHRIDRNNDGRYDQRSAVALMDTWWPRLIHGMFDSTLHGLFPDVALPFDDTNRHSHLGSSFQAGFYGYVRKAADMALGRRVPDRWRVLRCANGTRRGCRTALIDSLAVAVKKLGPHPSRWDAHERRDDVVFTPVGLIGLPRMPWQNRPTFQQVVSVIRHRPR